MRTAFPPHLEFEREACSAREASGEAPDWHSDGMTYSYPQLQPQSCGHVYRAMMIVRSALRAGAGRRPRLPRSRVLDSAAEASVAEAPPEISLSALFSSRAEMVSSHLALARMYVPAIHYEAPPGLQHGFPIDPRREDGTDTLTFKPFARLPRLVNPFHFSIHPESDGTGFLDYP